MSTPANEAPSFDSIMDGLKSGSISLSNDKPSSLGSQAPELDSEPAVEEVQEVSELEQVQEFMNGSSEEEEEESESEASVEKDKPKDAAKAGIEKVKVTDAKGRREVEVDFSDREKLKKYVQLAYGGRKWQQERDSARAELTKTQTDYTALKTDWDKVEKAYSENGVAGLVNLLEGRQDAFDSWYQQEQEKREAFNGMSEYEKQTYYKEEQARKQEAENNKLRQEYESKLKEIQTEREQAETRSLESRLHPAFDRYRFTGTLGDNVAEHHYDQALWNQALSNLEELPNDVELTQAIVDREFRKVAQAFKKVINQQVEKNTKKAVDNKKQAAASKAQATASRGIKKNSELENMRNSMKSGNIVDSLTSFLKAGGRL